MSGDRENLIEAAKGLGVSDPDTITPGSPTAIDLGCKCPVIDNRHGLGFYGAPDESGVFVISALCKIHWRPDDDQSW